MMTECIPDWLGFAPVEKRRMVSFSDGGAMGSGAGMVHMTKILRLADI